MSAAGRPHADVAVVQDEAPIDPRRTRRFQAATATVASERRPCFSRASTAAIWRTAPLFAASTR